MRGLLLIYNVSNSKYISRLALSKLVTLASFVIINDLEALSSYTHSLHSSHIPLAYIVSVLPSTKTKALTLKLTTSVLPYGIDISFKPVDKLLLCLTHFLL